jgi:putative restriction endonuclease
MERDEELRAACFLALDSLRAQLGDELPYRGGLDAGFRFGGASVPFLNRQKGIHRAARQRGSAALAVMTSVRSPYSDEETDEGFWYAYRDGGLDLADNRALRAAHALAVPIVYYVGTRPGWFRALAPCFVVERDDVHRRVLICPSPASGVGMTGLEPPDAVTRRYVVRQARTRLHQDRFRGLVLPAYRERCAVCRLREPRLLDAAHITGDAEPDGEAAIPNGLSLCSIHHRAFDEHLVGISPDRRVHVSPRLLDEDDGPMLDLLKGFHRAPLHVPARARLKPDPERLDRRFQHFLAASS